MMSNFNAFCLHLIRGIRTPADVGVYVLIVIIMGAVFGYGSGWVADRVFTDYCEHMVVMSSVCRNAKLMARALILVAALVNIGILLNGLRLRNGNHKVAPNKVEEE